MPTGSLVKGTKVAEHKEQPGRQCEPDHASTPPSSSRHVDHWKTGERLFSNFPIRHVRHAGIARHSVMGRCIRFCNQVLGKVLRPRVCGKAQNSVFVRSE